MQKFKCGESCKKSKCGETDMNLNVVKIAVKVNEVSSSSFIFFFSTWAKDSKFTNLGRCSTTWVVRPSVNSKLVCKGHKVSRRAHKHVKALKLSLWHSDLHCLSYMQRIQGLMHTLEGTKSGHLG